MEINKKETILIATNNKGKLKEIKEILSDFNIVSLKDINLELEVEEDGKTFEENSKKKSSKTSKATKMPCIADDSGLCIEIKDGWPGVYTARFAGEVTKNKRNEIIIKEMEGLENRKAKVVCVMSLYKDGKFTLGYGEIIGKIAKKARGENGFGFDEIFELENGKTLAELNEEEKNKISARRLALEDLKRKIQLF